MTKNSINPIWTLPLLVLWFLWHVLSIHPDYLYLAAPDEELYRGAFAKEILDGLKMPLINYRPDTHNGGFFAIGFLIAFFFKLFGTSYFILKFAPLTFALAGLFFWQRALSVELGKKTALFFSLLFIFSPPTFIRHLLWAMGNHPQILLFTGLSSWLYLSQISQKAWFKKNMVFLGFTLGLGFWFSYATSLALFGILIHAFINFRNQLKNTFPQLALGFLIGFSPWITVNTLNNFDGLHIHGDSVLSFFWHPMLIENLTAPSRFIGKQWFVFLLPLMENPAYWRTIGFIYIFLILLTFFFFTWRLPQNKSGKVKLPYTVSFLILYGAISLLFLQLWPVHTIRFCIPAVPILIGLLAYILANQSYLKYGHKILIGFVALGIVSQLLISDWNLFGGALNQKGYSYRALSTAQNIEPYIKNLDFAKSHLSDEDFIELVDSLEEAAYEQETDRE